MGIRGGCCYLWSGFGALENHIPNASASRKVVHYEHQTTSSSSRPLLGCCVSPCLKVSENDPTLDQAVASSTGEEKLRAPFWPSSRLPLSSRAVRPWCLLPHPTLPGAEILLEQKKDRALAKNTKNNLLQIQMSKLKCFGGRCPMLLLEIFFQETYIGEISRKRQ